MIPIHTICAIHTKITIAKHAAENVNNMLIMCEPPYRRSASFSYRHYSDLK
jgi:hypothetical protein